MKTLWNYFSFPIIRRWLSSSSNETYLNFFSHAESRTKEKEKEEGSKKCWCLVNAITFRFRRVDFWPDGGGEKPAFERSCYEYRNKRGAREKREYDEYEAVIKVKVAFRVIRDCCSNDGDSSVRKTTRVLSPVRAQTREKILVACSSRLTNPRRIMIRWMERACNLAAQIGGKQGVEIVGVEGWERGRGADESENLLEKDYCRLLEEKGKWLGGC